MRRVESWDVLLYRCTLSFSTEAIYNRVRKNIRPDSIACNYLGGDLTYPKSRTFTVRPMFFTGTSLKSFNCIILYTSRLTLTTCV